MERVLMRGHPNTTVSVGGSGVGVLIVWLAGHFGVSLSAEEGVVIAGAVTTAALFVGRKGLRGIARMIWRGDS